MEILKGPVYEAVDRVKVLVSKKPELVAANLPVRDNVGACLLHWCIIQTGISSNPAADLVIQHLVQYHWESVIDVPYKEPGRHVGLFDGETALHLAVVFGDTDLLDLLLEHNADTSARAYGSFFSPTGLIYFGEYALSFAVTCGQDSSAEILLRGDPATCARLLTNRDSFGNTVIHIAAIHRRKTSLKWLLEKCVENEVLQQDRIEPMSWQGYTGLTPLGLCTVLSHKDDGDMFAFIIDMMSRVEWVFGRIKCVSLPLEQIDTVALDPAAPQYVSILSLILCKKITCLIDNTFVVGILEEKWKQYGRSCLLFSFVCYVLRVVLTTWLSLEYKQHHIDEAFDNETSVDPPDVLMALEWMCFFDALIQTVTVLLDFYGCYCEGMVVSRIIREATYISGVPTSPVPDDNHSVLDHITSPKTFMKYNSVHRLENLLMNTPMSEPDILATLSNVLICVHTMLFVSSPRTSEASTYSLCFAVILMWCSSVKYTEFHQSLGQFTRLFIGALTRELPSFLAIFMVLLFGFSSGVHLLIEQDDGYHLHESFDYMLKMSFGLVDARGVGYFQSSGSWVVALLSIVFLVVTVFILCNLLMAVFVRGLTEARETALRDWHMARGRSILLVERRLKLLFPFFANHLRVNHNSGDGKLSHRFVHIYESTE